MDEAKLRSQLTEIYGPHRWIVATDVAAAAGGVVDLLRSWGAEVLAVVAGTAGIGAQPEDVPVILTNARSNTLMGGIRACEASLVTPSRETSAALDVLDPNRTARVYGLTLAPAEVLLDRLAYGNRPLRWLDLEDKMVIDELWDEVGVRRAPSAIVRVEDAPRVAPLLASDLGTVWVADNKEGWHGGGEYLRWVRSPDDEARALAWLRRHADQVRVMPFLDGTPCSIHGFASAEEVASFRPVEMVILRHADAARLTYTGPSTLWDPPEDHRIAMRRTAEITAEHLRNEVAYRGPFSIDGVMTNNGFLPTELNPRVSAGAGIQARSADFPLGSAVRAMTAGDLDVPASSVEQRIVAAADRSRWCRLHVHLEGDPEPRTGAIDFAGDSPRWTDLDPAPLEAEIGPSPGGSSLQLRFDTAQIEAGPSVAPTVASVLSMLEADWQLGLPEMRPAPELVGAGSRKAAG